MLVAFASVVYLHVQIQQTLAAHCTAAIRLSRVRTTNISKDRLPSTRKPAPDDFRQPDRGDPPDESPDLVSTLIAEIERLSGARVLCVGDVMLDRFVYGGVQRISPEAPVPVVKAQDSQAMPGGAANVARNLVTLGAHCSLVTVAGADAAGSELEELLQKLPNLTWRTVTDRTRPTTVKTRFVAANQQILRVDDEVDTPLAGDAEHELVSQATELMHDIDVVVLSDYAKGVLTPHTTQAIIGAARAANIPVIVDPKGADYQKYSGATLVTPNLNELRDVTGLSPRTDDAVEQATTALLNDVDIDAVVVTRSEQGMSVIQRDGAAEHFPTMAREVFDIAGAGDTVVATLAAAVGVGINTERAVQLANLAAGVVVGKVGTAAVQLRELAEAAVRDQGESLLDKVGQAEDVIARAQLWRNDGRRVGFTNGCFDLIHPGQISLISQAAARCDRLIVGLNSDSSVSRLKGPERPIQDELARALVLTAIRGVDAVIIFDEDTPESLIKNLRPDVLIKGADYKADQVVGADFVESYGGELYLASLTPNQSTTQMIQRSNSDSE